MLQLLSLVLLAWPSQADAPTPEPASPAPQDKAEDEGALGLRVREAEAFDGYTLVSPLNSRFTYLVGMDGEVVHSWKTDCAPGSSFYLLDDGSLLRAGRKDDNPRFRGGGIGGLIQRYDFEGNLIWQYQLADEQRTQHHDIELLPNGNVLAAAWEFVTAEEALAAGRHPRAVNEVGLWPDAVVEIRPTLPEGGEIVWEWRAWNHIAQDQDPKLKNYGEVVDRPGLIDVNSDHRDQPPETEAERRERERLDREMRAIGYAGGEEEPPSSEPDKRWKHPDWLHNNAVSYHPEYQLIVLSSPKISEILVIDHSTTTEEARGSKGGRWGRGGEVLYRWGNPRNYGAGTDRDRQLFRQHDPRWIPGEKPGELRLLIYNNGLERPKKHYSSIEELVLPFDPEKGFLREPGKAFGPKAPVWSYSDPDVFFSAFISGSERLPNGNTLICQGREGRVFEVTPDARIVWEWWNPYGGDVPPTEQSGQAQTRALFRATRVPYDHSGLVGRLEPPTPADD